MRGAATVPQQPCTACSPPSHPRRVQLPRSAFGARDRSFCSWNPKLVSHGSRNLPSVNLRCSCASDSGEKESRTILDAFFLGKAVAEAVNERVESAVGEILSAVGRLQAEQQKQVQEFQEDVLERAKRAKEQAAREAIDGGSSTITGSSASVNSFPESKPAPSD